MKYASVCSGIEAATVAWHGLGWNPQWFSEIEPFPCAVLKHHYPNIPNLGHVAKVHLNPFFNERTIDLLVGGTPCQSFSVAGLRKGLDDPRGNLALTFLSIADRLRAKWVVWENVPGVLSSSEGRDFGSFVGGLAELGYGFAYRILDAQFFGVAQRRRRVFVVGYLGDWRRAAAVLFERESLSGHPAPSRKKGQGVADSLTVGANQYSGFCGEPVEWPAEVANTLGANFGDKLGLENQHVNAGCPLFVPNTITHAIRTAQTKSNGHGIAEEVAYTLDLANGQAIFRPEATPINTMIMAGRPSDDGRLGSGIGKEGDPANTLTKAHSHGVTYGSSVRRLTPRECERLQGFPDDYTLLPDRVADGPRYKALGNSMAVPVMRWLGERINLVDSL